MITLTLEWREVLWWMQGGMSGSHNCWDVYKDMVNRVWPQCSEQERRNIWFIMRRDLGTYWRPDGWSGYGEAHGEGEWKPPMDDVRGKMDDVSQSSAITHQPSYIADITPWMYFRQVLARFDPENQYAVTMRVHNQKELDGIIFFAPAASVISRPSIPHTIEEYDAWQSDTATVTVRAYKWEEEYRIDWGRRCDASRTTKVERLTFPDDGTM